MGGHCAGWQMSEQTKGKIMSELKVEIPDGYRWVKPCENRNGAEWRYIESGKWVMARVGVLSCYSENVFITPILPPKPPQDWLDKHGVELTGECRVVNKSETGSVIFAALTDYGAYILWENAWVSKPAWILRKKAPPKPETVDVEIKTSKYDGWLEATNPNNDSTYTLASMPCIVGPDWAFAGFVWDDLPFSVDHYFRVIDGKTDYAKAVRFRRVQGGAM